MMNNIKTVLTLCAVLFSGIQPHGTQPDSKSVSAWISNAVQWDAVWGADLVCENGKFNLADQLKSSGSHTFRLETAEYPDGIVALLPDLHRLVSIRITPDQQLASIKIEPTCESGLEGYYAKLKVLPKEKPVQDPRLQQHLQKLEQNAQRQNPQEATREIGTLEIPVPVSKPSPSPREWPKEKMDALKSVEAAAQASFEQECAKGESAVAEVPDFELYDPALLVVVTAKDGSCILPVGFEHRQSSADPYVAYAKYHCFEDPKLLRKTQHLIRVHRASTKTLACRSSGH